MRTTFCILALFSVACATNSTSESVRISFSQKALDLGEEIAHIIIEVIQDEALTKLSIPDIKSKKFKVKNLKLESLSLDKPELSIVSNGLLWRNPNAHLKVSGDYSVKVGWWWKSGSLDLETVMEIKAGAKITAKNGTLASYPTYCGVKFNKFDLNLHNGFYSWVARMMEGSITSEIKDALCYEVKGLLGTTANEMISSLPHNIPVADVFSVKIEADSNPSFNKSGIVDIHARVKLDKQGSATIFPFSQEPMQSTMNNSYMACLLISDYTLNTGSYIALSAGTIDLEVPNDDIDGAYMNTDFFKNILPELYTAYPNMSMSFKIVNTRYPTIEFDADEVFINIPVDVSVMVNDSLVFDLAINMTVEAALYNVDNVVSAVVVGSVHNATLVSSVLPDDITDKLDDVVEFVVTKTILPELNLVLKKGIDIPTSDYVILKKGLLEAHEDFLKICGEIELTDDGRKEIKKAAEDIFD